MSSSKAILLIAEDDHIVRESTAAYLRKNGYTIHEASSGLHALKLFRDKKPDLVMTDLQMPELDGIELLAIVAKEAPATPVIIVSGMGTMTDAIKALRLGAWDYQTKPVPDLALLAHSIDKALERAGLIKKDKEHQHYLEEEVRVRTAELREKNSKLEQEIKERHVQEQLVLKAKKEWESTVDAMPDMVAIVDKNYKFVRMNRAMADKLKVDIKDVYGMTCFSCVHGTDAPPDYCPHAMILRDEQPRTLEIFEERLGGYFETTVLPYRDPDGTLIGSVYISRDINERKNAELEKDKLQSQLLHAQKLESVGQLASGIAHEINTPTQYIGTNVDFLDEAFQDIRQLMEHFQALLRAAQKENIPQKLVKEAAEAIEEMDLQYLIEEIPSAINQSKDGVKRVTSIVRAMKEFSHPGNKEKTEADLNKIIETTITVARNEWKYVAEVTTNFDPDLPPVFCLTDEMGQVILNMLVNAAHAIAEKIGENPEGKKGLITIRTGHDDTWLEMSITDSGSGIAKDIRDRIFDPFFTTKKVGRGTGQGLTITHDVITEKHYGKISVESEIGQGTTFTIKLPLPG